MTFNIIWDILGCEKPADARACWPWCFPVLQNIQSLEADENLSIETIYRHLTRDREAKPTTAEKDYTLFAIFAALCWTSMTLVPVLDPIQTMRTQPALRPSFRIQGLSPTELPNTCLELTSRRPITKLFNILRGSLNGPIRMSDPSLSADLDTIHESSVNCFSLHTIERVQIKWVRDLNSHLTFDRQSRTLSLFCYPTACVSSILQTRQLKVLHQ
ncbi:hypothetical protein ANO14919_034520 [Xylariales sp. No.14919]|nr:hypothetical protein ANO14919_034520 [Xylariales sp. No.14919]